ncbi:MAG TPA: hypothetical protein VLC48_02815, partial [Gemmatimonadota bacterium]|nr:hypothetical protein [Gemmatimonadota bacterium]
TTTSETGPGTLIARIGITSSFVERGDTLVGDTVVFVGRVTTGGGTEVPSSVLEFVSGDTTIVKILNSSSGLAVFRAVGSAEVTVRFDEPSFGNTTEKLEAAISVNVAQYEVELKLVSTITDTEVDTTEALQSDTVRVEATVRLNGVTVPGVSGVRIQSSSDPGVAAPVPPSPTDRAALLSDGQARLRVTLTEPSIPGSAPLADSINVTVVDFLVALSVQSLVAGSDHLDPNGDTLVTDSVRFSAFVVTSVTDSTPVSGATWTSTNTAAVAIRNASTGVAAFVGVGTADVQVTFTDPVVPQQSGTLRVPVTTLVPTDTLKSVFTAAVTDTLVTDSVQVIPVVTKSGQAQPGVVLRSIQSTDSSVIEIVDGPAGRILFADTGAASLIVTIDEPDLPRREVADTIPLRSTTYIASIGGPGSAPVMGDTVQYSVTVTETRGGTTLTSFDRTFLSSDASVIRFLNDSTGRALARDLGTTTVSVRLDDPSLPDPTAEVTDALAPTTISGERFYGRITPLTGDFGVAVKVYASEVHTFTDSTRIAFSNGTVLFVDSVWTDSIWAVVGAGTNASQLTFDNLLGDGSPDRDNVLSRATFAGQGGIADPYEPNDTFPLTTADSMGVSFEAVLSFDPSKADPIDNDFFYFFMQPGDSITAEVQWQQTANLDFYVCSGNGNPPNGVLAICQLDGSSSDTSGSESARDFIGAGGPYVLRVWCASSCPAVPVTYKVSLKP